METAHQGMVDSPGSPEWNNEKLAFGICDKCHDDIGKTYENSLHYTLNGFKNALEDYTKEGILETSNPVSFTWNANCYNCHADCGECHVSRPRVQNGGLLSGHLFEQQPPMKDTCAGCHSTRYGVEYTGEVGPSADTHFYDHDMICTDCHQVSTLHGNGELPKDMHEVKDGPQCITCHKNVMTEEKGIEAHLAHNPDLLDCTVCHSQEANGCQSCHVSFKDETKTGVTSHSEPVKVFKIAKNPNPNELHPFKYITVRHIPQTADMLDSVGYPKLDNYDKISNWQRSPTHNTQRFTPQNSSCNSCHGVKKVFLTEEDILPTDSKAVEDYLVEDIPPPIQ